MQSYRGKELTFRKPLICSPAQKRERKMERREERGNGDKEGEDGRTGGRQSISVIEKQP